MLTRKAILAAFAATIVIAATPLAAQAQDKSITVFAACERRNARYAVASGLAPVVAATG